MGKVVKSMGSATQSMNVQKIPMVMDQFMESAIDSTQAASMSLEDVTDLMNQFHNNTHVDTSSPTMRARSDSKPGMSANSRILCTPEPIQIPRLVETVPFDLKGRPMREPMFRSESAPVSPTLRSPSPQAIRSSEKFRMMRSASMSFTRNSPPTAGTPPRSPCARFPRTPARAPRPLIGQFYFPQGVPLSPHSEANEQMIISQLFDSHPEGLDEVSFREVATKVCKLSSYCSRPLFDKVDSKRSGQVVKKAFCEYYYKNLQTFKPVKRLFLLLSKPGCNFLERSDFLPLVREILCRHPGLQFLQDSEQFHERYVETVIARIFYHINKSGSEKLSFNELKRSNFMDILQVLDEKDDINEIFDYFSYEHFYVIYCKFWELDTDHDFVISREELLRYSEECHTEAIVDQILSGAPRKLFATEPGTMAYLDFIPFLISSEDKTNSVSIDYWFRCCDLDCDGVISPFEIQYFYDEQVQRIQHFTGEHVQFDDFLCQLNDMIKPTEEARFTRRDLRQSKLAPLFFNMLFNIRKFAMHEQRDPQHIGHLRSTANMTPWERFAQTMYEYYSNEEESVETDEGMMIESADQIFLQDEVESPPSSSSAVFGSPAKSAEVDPDAHIERGCSPIKSLKTDFDDVLSRQEPTALVSGLTGNFNATQQRLFVGEGESKGDHTSGQVQTDPDCTTKDE
eukprot:1005227_1